MLHLQEADEPPNLRAVVAGFARMLQGVCDRMAAADLELVRFNDRRAVLIAERGAKAEALAHGIRGLRHAVESQFLAPPLVCTAKNPDRVAHTRPCSVSAMACSKGIASSPLALAAS